MKKSTRICLFPIIGMLFLNGCAKTPDESTKDPLPTSEATETTSSETDESSAQTTLAVFEGQDIEGNAVSSEIFSESKLTMVNVWATYCNPCLNEMPGLGELAAAYDPTTFQIIGVISDVQEGADTETMELAADLIAQTNANYTHLLLNESLYYALLTEVTAVPTTFFIDENGVLIDSIVGAMEKSAWEEKINALLEEL